MTGYVYAMERHDGLFKIGWSRDPFARLIQVSRADGAHSMRGFARGAKGDETRAHKLLAPHRSHREWFFPHPHVVAFVSALPLKSADQVETIISDAYAEIIAEVDGFVAASGLSAAAIGEQVFNDRGFIFDLRKGRRVTLGNVTRLLDFVRAA